MSEDKLHQRRSIKKILGRILIVITVLLVLYFAIAGWDANGKWHWATAAYRLADPLRAVIGNEGVAKLEAMLFRVRDAVRQVEYSTGGGEPVSPWEVGEAPQVPASLTPVWTATPPTQTPTPAPTVGAQDGAAQVSVPSSPVPTPEPLATATPSPTPLPTWMPPPADSLSGAEGEGVWQPYLYTSSGRMVAARTFVRPDPERPYAYVAIVAFDLRYVHLNYVLGLAEPAEPGGLHGDGTIPEEDLNSGTILAAFNGGFKATHGHYGAMLDGLVPIRARWDYATLAIYDDGRLHIGEWGPDFNLTSDMLAYRQNCRMVIHEGQIGEYVFINSAYYWGGTVDWDVVVIRSGIGMNQDENILYYFAGPSISMPTLADAMLAVDVWEGMLLDINDTSVHFTAFDYTDTGIQVLPLLPDEMETDINRYIAGEHEKDFFYITAADEPAP